MLDKTRQRTRSRSISMSLDLLEKIKRACGDNISVSSFIKMSVVKELEKLGIGDSYHD